MARQSLDFGTSATNDGESLFAAFTKAEANFVELYAQSVSNNTAVGPISTLTPAADTGIYYTSSTEAALFDLTTFARSLLASASAAAVRSLLGLDTEDSPQFTAVNIGHATDTTITRASAGRIAVEGSNVLMTSDIGTSVQAYDAELAALAGLTSSADRVPYFTGSGTADVADFTSAGRAMVAAVSSDAQTALLAAFTGDSGSGGVKGLVPAPAAGDAAATKFLKADGTWTTPSGAGDVTGPASSVDSEIVLFDGTDGKTLKRASTTGVLKATSGVISAATAGTDFLPPIGMICNGRLTITTDTPFLTSTTTGATTLYFTPVLGNRIALYDGSSAWAVLSFSELSLSLSGYTASKPYDIWIYNNSGTAAMESTVWTDDTTRATALTLQDGVWVKTGATTRRYVGTIRTNSSSQVDFNLSGTPAAGGTAAVIGLWNLYNRVPWSVNVMDSTNSWTYTTTSFQAANASSAMRASFIVGVAGLHDVQAVYNGVSSTTSGGARIGVGYDSTTTASGSIGIFGATSGVVFPSTARFGRLAEAGFHYMQAIERGNTGVTFYGDNGTADNTQAALHVSGWY